MSRAREACEHEWGGWVSEERVVAEGHEYVLVRTCIKCNAVDEMAHGREP